MATLQTEIKVAEGNAPATHWFKAGRPWRKARAGASGNVELDCGNEWLITGWFNKEMDNHAFFERIEK